VYSILYRKYYNIKEIKVATNSFGNALGIGEEIIDQFQPEAATIYFNSLIHCSLK
jgi:hypothetical protein